MEIKEVSRLSAVIPISEVGDILSKLDVKYANYAPVSMSTYTDEGINYLQVTLEKVIESKNDVPFPK